MDVTTDSARERTLGAEMAVIGALCIDPEHTAGLIFHRLQDSDFGDAGYRNLFRAARQIWLDQRPLDPVTLLAAAGQEYEQTLRQCMMLTPTAGNTEAYAEIVSRNAKLRKLQEIGSRLTFFDGSLEDARKLISEAETLLTSQRSDRVWNYRELLEDYLDRQNSPEPLDYLDWGIQEMNDRVHVSPGRFVVLGADSSVGKTAFALQLAYNMAKAGKRVGFFSYETSHQDAADRIFANTASAAMSRAKRKQLNALDAQELIREGDISDQISLTVEDSGDWTVEELRARTLAQRYEVIFIDYVQIIPGDSRKARWEVVTDLSMQLHRMASSTGVTVIALSQVTPPEKGQNGRRKGISRDDLRESRQLVNDAEVILMMDLTDTSNPDSDRELRIEKNKDGKRGRLWLKFDPDHMRFTPCPQPQAQKYAEYREKMKAVKAQQKAETEQLGFEELKGRGGDLPF